MSFRVDLWNGFEKIKAKINTMQRKMKQFVKIMNTLVNIEKEYSKSIDLLLHDNREIIKTGYNFEDSLYQMLEDIKEENENRKMYYTNLTKDIINPLQEIISSPKTEFTKTLMDNEESKDLYKKSIANLISKQENFHYNCQELCYFLVEKEIDKINCEKNNNIYLLENKNYTGRQQKLMEKLNNSKEEYIIYLNETNIDREKYNEITEQRLEFLEKYYRDIISKFHRKSLLYVSNRLNVLHKNLIDEKFHCNLYEKINIDNEIFDFVVKNCTKEFPLPKIEFCPFKTNIINSKINARYQQKYTNKEYNQIFKTMNNFFIENKIFPTNLIQTGISKLHKKVEKKPYIIKKKGFGFFWANNKQENENNENEEPIFENIKFIEKFINDIISLTKNNIESETKIIRGKIPENLRRIIELLLSKDNKFSLIYIETLIKILSNNRSKGNSLLTDETFKIIKDICFVILDDVNYKSNDYVLKNILILSQTFYHIDKEKNEKIYIQNGIKNTSVFNKPETWHRIINYSLNLGLVNLNDVTSSFKITKEEQLQKLQKMSFNTVVSYLCDLKLLTGNIKVFEIIKNYYVEIYKMDMKKVNDYIIAYFKGMGIEMNLNGNINEDINKINIIEDENLEKRNELVIEKGVNIVFYMNNNNLNSTLKKMENNNIKMIVDTPNNNKIIINENGYNKNEKKEEEKVETKLQEFDEKMEEKMNKKTEDKIEEEVDKKIEEITENKNEDGNETRS